MKLVTKAIEKAAPKIGATSNKKPEEIRVIAKYFTPWTSWTWYMTEYDPATKQAFGFVHNYADPYGAELGYFSISELESLKGPFGLKIERDLHYSGTLAEAMDKTH